MTFKVVHLDKLGAEASALEEAMQKGIPDGGDHDWEKRGDDRLFIMSEAAEKLAKQALGDKYYDTDIVDR